MDYTNRTYAFVYTTDIDEVDFSQVMETSAETVRKSIDESQFLLKWEDEIPSSVSSLTTKQGPYTYTEILEILTGPEWSSNDII